jgi:hypothetical protein
LHPPSEVLKSSSSPAGPCVTYRASTWSGLGRTSMTRHEHKVLAENAHKEIPTPGRESQGNPQNNIQTAWDAPHSGSQCNQCKTRQNTMWTLHLEVL